MKQAISSQNSLAFCFHFGKHSAILNNYGMRIACILYSLPVKVKVFVNTGNTSSCVLTEGH